MLEGMMGVVVTDGVVGVAGGGGGGVVFFVVVRVVSVFGTEGVVFVAVRSVVVEG